MNMVSSGPRWIVAGLLCLLALGSFGAESDDASAAAERATRAAAESTTNSLSQQIKVLRKQILDHRAEIHSLSGEYKGERGTRKKEVSKQAKTDKAQTKQLATQRDAIQSLQQQFDEQVATNQVVLTAAQKDMRSRLETLQASIESSQYAERTTYDKKTFRNSLPIPGSSAAIRIGGFVKMNVVKSFDPVGSKDRFIAGTIPVPKTEKESALGLTVNESRLNLDLRDTTKQAESVRAFIEADFDGTGNTLRLRHAFGQYQNFLVGKTWSTFMDFDVVPEDLDFEGLNAQIHVRHTQIRYSPQIGEKWNLMMAMEDPNPQITGGQAISEAPDLILSARRKFFEHWHLKTAFLLRQIEGTCNCESGRRDTAYGWGMSASGKMSIGRMGLPWWDSRDNFMFQVNYGSGYASYVNDTRNIGGQDAVFDPSDGSLSALPVFACYIATQKWWTKTMRSNINAGYVQVYTTDFQPDDAYKSTVRIAANTIWSPASRVDLGIELLYGDRKNKDGESADAMQLQLSTTYRY